MFVKVKPSLALALISISICASAVESRAPQSLHKPGSLEHAIVRDTGLTLQEFAAHNAKAKIMAEVEFRASRELGEDFAGTYLRRKPDNTFSVVLLIRGTKSNLSKGVHNPDEFVRVTRGLAELNAMMEKFKGSVKTFRAEAQSIVEGSVDVINNRLEISVSPTGRLQDADALLNASGIPAEAARTSRSKATPKLQAIYNAGDATDIDVIPGMNPDEGKCTLGFATFKDSDWDGLEGKGVLTAAHCTNPYYVGMADTDSPPVYIANVIANHNPSYRFTWGLDFAWAKMRAGHSVANRVSSHGVGGNWSHPVIGTRLNGLGSYVCKSGRSTGWTCGYVNNMSTNLFHLGRWGLVRVVGINNYSAGGDSGGPTFQINFNSQFGLVIDSVEASGIHSAGSGGTIGYFAPIYDVLDTVSYGPIVLTTEPTCGRLPSGYRIGGAHPGSRSSVTSCNGLATVKVDQATQQVAFFENHSNGTSTIAKYLTAQGHSIHMRTDGSLVEANQWSQVVRTLHNGILHPGTHMLVGHYFGYPHLNTIIPSGATSLGLCGAVLLGWIFNTENSKFVAAKTPRWALSG